MPVNYSNLTSDFAGPATPTDPIPNEDINKALGYGSDPNDDFMTAFGKAFQAGQFRNSDEGRKLTAEYAKQKLANQLAEQLQKRKYELAQQYEPYSHFFQLPNGAIVGAGQGGVKEMYSNPDVAAGWTAKNNAEIAKNNFEASPAHIKSLQDEDRLKTEHVQSQINLNNATTDIYRPAQADLDKARKRALDNPTPKPRFETYKDALAAAMLESGMDIKDPMFQHRLQQGNPAAVQAMQRIQSRAQQLFSEQNKGMAAPAAPGAGPEAPDLTGAFSPIQVD